MPEEEKVENFISLWRKKMIDDPEKPKVIGETLDRIKEVEKENEKLRNKIGENIELISKTEEIVRKTIEENTRLKEEIKQGSLIGENQVEDLQKENLNLSNRIKSLINSLTEKDNNLSIKDNNLSIKDNEIAIKNTEIAIKDTEITELKLKLNEAQSTLVFMADTAPEDDSEVSKALIGDLQSELSTKKTQIVDLEKKIEDLNSKITILNEQLIEKETTTPVDNVIPVDTPEPEVLKPQPTQTSSRTLEILCQDLQADLNKYKRIVENLTKEKSELKETIVSGGFKLEPGEIKELKKENEELRTDLSQLQEILHEKTKTTPQTLSLVEAERLIEDLQEQLKIKDKLITGLKTSSQTQIIAPKGPVSGLIEQLQTNINKLKITLEEKNIIIEKLKSS
jgi:chromosome segregation ATPase